MSHAAEVSPEDFAAICRSLDLTLAPDEAERLRAAYGGLRQLLRRLPRSDAFFPEPAIVFAQPGTRLTR